MKRYTLTAIALAVACASQAHAAGYQLNEYSITGLGRSFAGAGVVGDDYSAIAYNPAGMTLKKAGAQLSMTVAEVASEMKSQDRRKPGEQTEMDFGVPLPAVYAPHHTLVFVAGNGHLNGSGVALGNGSDVYVIAHMLFLSQPSEGCIQKRQLTRRIL